MPQEQIAVVGIGCKVPGADNVDQFWQLLERGENHVVEIPKDRWNNEAFYDPDPIAVGKSYVQKAGLLKDPLAFDNKLFNINDFEADQMDPQQRLVCECSYMALEDGGFPREQLAGSRTGVYVGAMNADYRSLFSGNTAIVNNYTVTGVSNSIIAARISFIFDLRGPSLTLDTACSSGLLAVHLGAQALRTRDCDMALCGGTNFFVLPDTFVHLSKARMVSPTGQCFAFSDRADGYTRGEGCGMVLIKRLKDALRDGDHIWATLETSSNQDGRAVTPISAPSGEQQIKLLEHIYETAGIDAKCIDYIEAHGTGTAAGDPVEVNALGSFFKTQGAERQRHIGSVKTNVGHLESAAGTAGLIKVLLMMKHSKIVPSLFFDRPNPKIDFEGLKLNVPTKVLNWLTPKKVACVNSFGMGGTNCHAVAMAHDVTSPENQVPQTNNIPCIVCFSAKNEKSLKGSIEDFATHPEVNLLSVHDVSYTSTIRRSHYNIRYATVVEDTEELMKNLEIVLHEGLKGSNPVNKPRLVYFFCGMGTSWKGMCKEFMKISDVFRDAIREIDSHLCNYVSWSLEERFNNSYDPSENQFSAIAIFACQLGLGKLWESLGVTADCIVGQSVGEVAAAFFAGILSMRDAVKIIYHRTSIMAKAAGGAVVVIKNMKVETVADVVQNYSGSANVSLRYSPIACAVSGDTEAISNIKNELLSKAEAVDTQIQLIDLNVSVAYHSHHMEVCKEELRRAIADISPHPPSKNMISSVTGEIVTGPLGPEYWVDNMREPVSFYEAVQKTLKKMSTNIYIEIGPKPVLRAHIDDIFQNENMISVISMSKPPEWKTYLRALATIYVTGVKIIWQNLPCQSKQVTTIPRYCFNPRRNLQLSESAHLVLSGVCYMENENSYLWKTHTANHYKVIMSRLTFPSVYDHTVSNVLILPGAFYAEIGFAVCVKTVEMNAPLYSVGVIFDQPFSFTREGIVELDVDVEKAAPCHHGVEKFDSYNIAVVKGDETFARIHLQAYGSKAKPTTINIAHIEGRCPRVVSRDEIYEQLKKFGFTYGPNYSLLMQAQRCSNECIAKIVVPQDLNAEVAKTTIHPSVLDGMIQTAVILTDDSNDVKDLFPKSIKKLTSHKPTEAEMYIFTKRKSSARNQILYDVKLTSLSGEVIADLEDLTIMLLSGNTKGMDNMYTTIWKPVESRYPNEAIKSPKTFFISDNIPHSTSSTLRQHCLQFDVTTDSEETITQGLEILLTKSTHSYEFIVLVINTEIKDDEDASIVHTKALHLCLMLKHIYTYAVEKSLTLPIYLFTKRALPFKGGKAAEENVNPVLTALWGMARCALKEQVYTDFVSIDLHLPSEMCTLGHLASIAEIIKSNSILKNYPEWLVTEENLYVNQFVQHDPQSPLPTFRYNFVDNSQKVILLSKDPAIPTDTVLVHHESIISYGSSSCVEMNVTVTALQNPNLFNMKIPYNKMENHIDHNRNSYPLFALEHKGTAHIETSGKKQKKVRKQLVSCYPTPVGSKIEVPVEATLGADLITNYAPGDLTKLAVLWSLCELIITETVTILASSTTAKLAEALTFLLDRGKSKSVNVNIVFIEELDQDKCFNQTILSLVLIEETVVSVLTQSWSKRQFLILPTSLLEPTMETTLVFLLPGIEIKTLDPSSTFQPPKIVPLIAKLRNWIEKHLSLMPKVAACLHNDPNTLREFKNVISDLSDLLEVMILKMDGATAQVDKSKLFRKDAVYIVVGGLSGLGWLFVKFLAQSGAGNIAILNRREATKAKKVEIGQLSSCHNSQIKAYQADVTDMGSLTKFLNVLTADFPGAVLKGIFFGAAVAHDQLLLQTDPNIFAEVIAPKVKGTWNLHQLTKNIPLDYFVMHSSITSVLGNAGQTNYGSGNAFMDGLAHYRKHMNLSAQSINWGALGTGMLTDKAEIKNALEAQGFVIMSEEDIAALILPVLLLDKGQIAPCTFNDQVLRQRVKRDMLVPFQYRMKTFLGSGIEEVQIENDLKQRLPKSHTLPLKERQVLHEQYITALSCQVLGVDDRAVELDSNLLELGMDSTFAMVIVNQIFKEMNCRIPPIVLLSGSPTVKTIVQAIENELTGIPNGKTELQTGNIVETEKKEENPAKQHQKGQFKNTTYGISASFVESCLLIPHKRYTVKERLHGILDLYIPPVWNNADTICQAILSTFEMHQSASVAFRTVVSKTMDNPQFEKIFLPPGVAIDFTEAESHEEFQKYCEEEFDILEHSLLRFVLLQRPRAKLRVVYHKAGFDDHSIIILMHSFLYELYPHIKRLNKKEEKQMAETAQYSLVFNDELGKIYNFKAELFHLFWQKALEKDVNDTSLRRLEPSQLSPKPLDATSECVRQRLSSEVSKKVISFLRFHHVSLLGLVTGAYQILLHVMTGKPSVGLMFTLNLRHYFRDFENCIANWSNEIPLLAEFDKTDKTTCQSFIVDNNKLIQEHINHGLLPLTLFHDLVDKVTDISDKSPHGISINMLTDQDLFAMNIPQDNNKSTSPPAILSLGQETNLVIQHDLGSEVIFFNFCYKTCVMNRTKAEAFMTHLINIITGIVRKKSLRIKHFKKYTEPTKY